MVPFSDGANCEAGQCASGLEMQYWLLLALRKPKAHIHNFPGYPAGHGLFRGTARAHCICIHPPQAAKTGGFMGVEKENDESASSQCGY